MNNDRRKSLRALEQRIEELDQMRQSIMEALEALKDEEQEALGNLPESLQEGERGQAMAAAVEAMDSAHSDLDMIDFDAVTSSIAAACA